MNDTTWRELCEAIMKEQEPKQTAESSRRLEPGTGASREGIETSNARCGEHAGMNAGFEKWLTSTMRSLIPW